MVMQRFAWHDRHVQLVLPGALHRAIDVRPGDHIRVEFTGIGSVDAHFAA